MYSWKNNLTRKLSNPGIFVPRGGMDRYTDVVTKEIVFNGSTMDVTMGRNSKTGQLRLIDHKLTSGEAVKDVTAWLKDYSASLNSLGNQAHAIAGTEPEPIIPLELTPLENPSIPSPSPERQLLADPHE